MDRIVRQSGQCGYRESYGARGFPNPDGRLTPGLFARVRIPISPRHPALLISESAIGTDQGQKYVLIVDKEEIAQYRKVHLGAVVDDKRIVTDGLSFEDEVIIDGLARVRPGMKVAPEATREAPPTSGPKEL